MMFSSQDVDYSLNRPCRCLSAVARPPSSKCGTGAGTDDDCGGGAIDGWDDDDGILDLGSSSSSLAGHRFLAGTATPSVSRLASDGNGTVVEEEDDEERTNRLCLLRYDEDSHELALERSWTHPPGEVWSMACHPMRADWVVTCGGGAIFSASMMMEGEGEGLATRIMPLAKFRTALWRLPELNADEEGDEVDIEFSDEPRRRTESTTSAMTSSSRMELLVTIPHGESHPSTLSGWRQRVGQVLWNPLLLPSQAQGSDPEEISSGEVAGSILTVGWDVLSPLSLWDISSHSEAREVWTAGGSDGGGVATSRRRIGSRFGRSLAGSVLPRRASWNPHDAMCVLAASGVDVISYDMRIPSTYGAGAGTAALRSAHRHGVADVCHNPLKPNTVVTSGMDGVIKFWDLRMHLSDGSLDAMGECGGRLSMAPSPLLLKAVRGGHSHWTTRIVYNPIHDQLVLSGGSDGVANLWRISSCSSAPLLDLEGEGADDDGSGRGSLDSEGDGEDRDGEENAEGGAAGGDYGHSGWFEEGKKNLQESGGDDEDKSSSPATESNAQDIRVTRFECSDGTADIAWSASDPWVYTTLSYDGGFVVHHVPSKEKYKILL